MSLRDKLIEAGAQRLWAEYDLVRLVDRSVARNREWRAAVGEAINAILDTLEANADETVHGATGADRLGDAVVEDLVVALRPVSSGGENP